jgi:hypothetical protein
MGADLYIKNLPRELQYTGFQTSVDKGYYRDSYNNTNLLWQFNLSYWADISKKYTKDGRMSIVHAQMLLDELKKREPIFRKNLKDLVARKNRIWDYTMDSTKPDSNRDIYKPDESLTMKDRKNWVKEYQKEYKILKAFLRRAIKLDSAIECSL